MPQGNRAPVDVQPFPIPLTHLLAREELHGVEWASAGWVCTRKPIWPDSFMGWT
jgi:hypothetical protein